MHSVLESLLTFTAAAEGSRRALFAGLGIVSGCLVWAASVAVGLGVLLVASRLAYTVLRWRLVLESRVS